MERQPRQGAQYRQFMSTKNISSVFEFCSQNWTKTIGKIDDIDSQTQTHSQLCE